MWRLILAAMLAGAPAMAPAQGFTLGEPVGVQDAAREILVMDFDRVFAESAFGRRVTGDIEEAGSAIAAENRRIEAELTEEERRLTTQRESLPASEFRALADAFDEKVQRLRREQDAKARALGERSDDARRLFLSAAQPVIEALMEEAGAEIILERRTVFAATDAVDVTDRAIERIDAAIGAGTEIEDPAPDETPRQP